MDSRFIDESSLSASSRIRGCCLRIFVIPWGITTPNLVHQCRSFFYKWLPYSMEKLNVLLLNWFGRYRVDIRTPQCFTYPGGIPWIILLIEYECFDMFCAGRIFTVWPSAESFRYQWWDVAHDSIPIVHGEMFAKSDKKCDRMTRFFGSDFKMIIGKYEMIVTISQIYFRL